MKRTVCWAFVLLVVASACGSGRATEDEGGGAIRWVDVDAQTNRFNASFLAFFPSSVTVGAGDTVKFRSVWTGEPHNVTMGRLVDKAFSTKGGVAKLPQWTLGESTILPANIGRPCYLSKGAPPKDSRVSCPEAKEVPEFTGKQTYFSSGFLPEDAEFDVKIAGNTKPGTYRFFCSFHGEQMSGEMNVVTQGTEIPSQDEVDDEAKRKLRALIDETLPLHATMVEPFDRARAGSFPWPALASFEAGDGTVKVNEFVPFTLKAKVNERVRWNLLGAHTIAFSAPENAKPPAIRVLTTGETELKAEAINENRSPEPPVGAPKKAVVLEAPPYGRNTYLSSGMLFSPARGRITYVMRFEDPGSYRYECLLHPRMTGLVTVSV